MHIKFEPARGFEKFSRRLGEFASEVEKGVSIEIGGFKPKVDIFEDEKNIYFEIELAGVSKENTKVSVNDEMILSVKGEKNPNFKTEERNCRRSERRYGEFVRSFQLPLNADRNNIDARFENGTLLLTVGKIAPAKPKEQEVEIK